MSTKLERRPIGDSGVEVSVLGFGTMAVGGQYAEVDDAAAVATIEAARGEGITYFDTAPQYGCGLAEERLGKALTASQAGLAPAVVSSKVGKAIVPLGSGGQAQRTLFFPGGHDAEMAFDFSASGTLRIVEASLARLGLDRIDMLLIHDVTRHFHGEAIEAVLAQAMSGALVALRRLRDEGRVRAIGIGLKDCDVAARFIEDGDIDVALIPGRLNLLDQSAATSGVLDLCSKHGVTMIAAAPFDTGILATGATAGARASYQVASAETLAKVEHIAAVCAEHEVELATAALHYPLQHPAVGSVLAGMKSPGEVRQNAEHIRRVPPRSLWQALGARCGVVDLSAA